MSYEKELTNFTETKQLYTALREIERNKIINYLIKKGYKVSKKGGMGKPHYSSNSNLQRKYDLTNWKWISFVVGDTEILISLQAFDYDSKSNNYHVLMDRIGICSYPKIEKHPNCFDLMKVTSLELPLDKKHLKELYEIMQKMM